MGCGSSSPANVIEGGKDSNGNLPSNEDEARGIRPPPTGAADDDDIPTEVLPESSPAPIKPPLAFEIPLVDGEASTEGLVKKHPPRPPRRLQRLNTMDTPTTLQDLQEKLESAEKRRQTILQNRIASANKATRQMTRMMTDAKDDAEDIDEILHSPTRDFTELKNIINTEEHGVKS